MSEPNILHIDLTELYNADQLAIDSWVASKAKTVPAGSKVIDIGAGTCPYKHLFDSCEYTSQDFKKHEIGKLMGGKDYGEIDIVSDICCIPVPDQSYDVVLCTGVIEHVPEPILAVREMSRILKKGGMLFLNAPLGSGLHQEPYHFYGGFTPHWYNKFLPEAGFTVLEITPNGGFFKTLAQECARVVFTMDKHRHLHENPEAIESLFGVELPIYLTSLDQRCLIPEFTTQFRVVATKQ